MSLSQFILSGLLDSVTREQARRLDLRAWQDPPGIVSGFAFLAGALGTHREQLSVVHAQTLSQIYSLWSQVTGFAQFVLIRMRLVRFSSEFQLGNPSGTFASLGLQFFAGSASFLCHFFQNKFAEELGPPSWSLSIPPLTFDLFPSLGWMDMYWEASPGK